MSAKRMDLNKKCFFILSGLSNPLGKDMALEMCSRFQQGSLALLIDANEEQLQEVRKEIEFLERGLQVVCCNLMDWQNADRTLFHNLLATVLSLQKDGGHNGDFELALIVHNEGTAATHMLMEPEDAESWKVFVHQQLYAAVALNQEFIECKSLKATQKLAININSRLMVQPMIFSNLNCSCLKARDMYFRSVAAEEAQNGVSVITYAPGLLQTHQPEYDSNNNIINVHDVLGEDDDMAEKIMKLPRVEPKQATLKLINILEETSFISGHEVDYYDTYVL